MPKRLPAVSQFRMPRYPTRAAGPRNGFLKLLSTIQGERPELLTPAEGERDEIRPDATNPATGRSSRGDGAMSDQR